MIVRRSSLYSQPASFDPAYRRQDLQRARASAAPGKLLSAEVWHGPYGNRFWEQVALGVPGRTAGECLDAYLAAHSSSVARFSVSGMRLPDATEVIV